MKARINGVVSKMTEFQFLFCLMLAERLQKHCDNLSKTIQSTAMPAVEARRLADLCIEVFQGMRNDGDFDVFWKLSLQTQEQLQVHKPTLPCQR